MLKAVEIKRFLSCLSTQIRFMQLTHLRKHRVANSMCYYWITQETCVPIWRPPCLCLPTNQTTNSEELTAQAANQPANHPTSTHTNQPKKESTNQHPKFTANRLANQPTHTCLVEGV